MPSPKTMAAVLCMAVVTGACAGQEISLEPVADNTLYESPGGLLSNGAGEGFFVGVDAVGRIKRGLVRFDVSEIPAGSVVVEAELALTMNRALTGPNVMELHRASKAWGEGASMVSGEGGGGGPAEPGDATWLHTFYDDMFWNEPGGDFDAEISASAEVAQIAGVYTWDGAGLTADVQAWVDDPSSNHGWLVKGEDETARASAKRFVTREGPAGSRPTLRVVYESGGGCAADCDGSGFLDFFDFLCFQDLFAAGDPKADCDGSGGLDFFDFLCFQNEFAAGC
jgi:hypothetical protein